MSIRILWVCCVILCAMNVCAQEKVRYFSIDDGLSNNTATCIFKDDKGYMWFGTYDGVNRFDGYSFKKFNHIIGDTSSLAGNLVTAINEDNRGRLWVAAGPGISILDNSSYRFSRLRFYPLDTAIKSREPVLLENQVRCIGLTTSATMLVGTDINGLISVPANNQYGTQLQLLLPGKPSISNYEVSAILPDKGGRALIFVKGWGICSYESTTNTLRLVKQTAIVANCLVKGRDEELLIGADDGIYKYTDNGKTLTKVSIDGIVSYNPGRVMSLCLEKNDKLWIATDGQGVKIINLKTLQTIPLSEVIGSQLLSSNAMYCLYKDNQERIWIGTFRGGINMIDYGANPFYTLRLDDINHGIQSNNFIFSFYEDESGNIWIGTDGAGISIWNRRENKMEKNKFVAGKNGLPGNGIPAIAADGKGTILVAVYGQGVFRYSKASRSFTRINTTAGSCKYPWRICKDHSGNLWIAACNEENGLFKYDSQKDQLIRVERETGSIFALTMDKDRHLWIGNQGKMQCLDTLGNILSTINTKSAVRSIFEANDGTVWAGTQGEGLIMYQHSKVQFLSEAEGLSNNNVLNILEDRNHFIWVSTFNGLSKLSPREKRFENFFDVDGIQSNQFYYNAAIRLSTGEFIFGGIKGYTVFQPELCVPKTTFPQLTITGIRILNEEITSTGNYVSGNSISHPTAISVPYSKAVLSFDFTALEYSLPQKIQYSYFLEGWDKTWIQSNTVKTANYSELKEGGYRLHIKSTNVSGIWSNDELIIPVNVLPPWYRTTLFRVLLVLFLAGIIVAVLLFWDRHRNMKYRMKVADLKYRHEMALNEKRLSFFTNISHEFRTPLTLIINPIRELLKGESATGNSYNLSVLHSNAQRLLKMADQLLLFRKTDNELGKMEIDRLDLLNLCREVYFSFSNEAKSKQLEYSFDAAVETAVVNADIKKIEIILYNLIANAIKFSYSGGYVRITLTEKEDNFIISVADNGPGIPIGTGNKLFEKFYQDKSYGKNDKGFGIGLFLAKAFTEMHNATLDYFCPESGGTVFTFSMKRGQLLNREERSVGTPDTDIQQSGESTFLTDHFIDPFQSENLMEEDVLEDNQLNDLIINKKILLVVDDDQQFRSYIRHLFSEMVVYEASDAAVAWDEVNKIRPDIILCDLLLDGTTGAEFCKRLKSSSSFGHIPLILLTGSSSAEHRLNGTEHGADDYFLKPFDSKLLIARVNNIIKDRQLLKKFFFNEVTLQQEGIKVSDEYSGFLTECIRVVEENIDSDNFDSKIFSKKMGMSRSKLYVKVKSISGLSVNEFVKLIRLRKAAELMIQTDLQVKEICFQVGFNDPKYFREQFVRLFKLKPSDYIKKYRKQFQQTAHLNEQFSKIKKNN